MTTKSDSANCPPTPMSRQDQQKISIETETATLSVSSYFGFKYALEWTFALILFCIAFPLILILGAIVKLTSAGPAIYKQTRVGLGGREFSMLKIRTMVVDAESNSGPQWSTESDPRVTMIGRFLRFAHLDELPQLLNVIKGEMTIIGPRPERPDFVRILDKQVEHYSDRLKVKPGITGLAQIYLPPDQEISCVKKKICFDRAYIGTANLSVDIRIWLCTLVRVMGVRQGRGPRFFGLDSRYRKIRRQCAKIEQSIKKSTRTKAKPKAEPDRRIRKDSMQVPSSNQHNGASVVACTDSGIGLLKDTPRLPK